MVQEFGLDAVISNNSEYLSTRKYMTQADPLQK